MIQIYLLTIFYFLNSVNAGSNLRTSFEPFQTLTNAFLRTIQPNQNSLNLSVSLINNITENKPIPTDPLYFVNTYWKTYVGHIVLLIIGILFIIFFTLVGFCFCCCRVCCKKCGAKQSTFAKKNMKKKRIVFNILLFIFASMILIGAIVAMASNFIFLEAFQSQNQTNDINGNFFYNINEAVVSMNDFLNYIQRNILVDGINIIRVTINQAVALFQPVINTFINTFKSVLNIDKLINSTNSLISLYNSLQNIARNLSTAASQHKTLADNFTNYLDNLRNNLTSLLTNETCANISSCNDVKNYLKDLIIGFNISNINYTSDIQAQNILSSYNISGMESALSSVNNTLTNITNEANSTITNFLTTMIKNVNGSNLIPNIEKGINNTFSSISSQLKSYTQQIFTIKIDSYGSLSDGGLYSLVKYGFYGLCGLISLILLIVLLLYIGLCFGTCGGPKLEDAASCNKGTGSGFLMGAFAVSVIFGWLIMLIVIIMFFPGSLITTEFCSYVNTTDQNQIQSVDSIVSNYFSKYPLKFQSITIPNLNYYQSLVLRCPNSTDFISAFQIPPQFMKEVSSYIFKNFIESYINDTTAKIKSYSMSNFNTTSMEENLNKISSINTNLKNSLSNNTIDELAKPVSKLNSVNGFKESLNKLINELNAKNKSDDSIKIKEATKDLDSSFNNMGSAQNFYYTTKVSFDSTIRLFDSAITNVITDKNLVKSQPETAKIRAVLASQTKLIEIAENRVNSSIYGLLLALGNCKGMSESFKKVTYPVCYILLGPFNNIWMGIGWFLLFIIPAIIFAVKLSGLYRISHIESESSAYNHAYMSSNMFLSKENLEMIRRPQKT